MKRILKHAKYAEKMSDSISLCMIMKDEEKRLGRCLDSVYGLVDEIIIVDTGSTDRSIKIAHEHGARVMNSPWCDDFAFSRNVGLKVASKNWILMLDPDEVISKSDHAIIREHTLHHEIVCWRMDTRNYGNNPFQVDSRANPIDMPEAKNYKTYVPSTKTRLFQNWRGLRFEGCWHELIDYASQRKKLPWASSMVQIHHYPEEICQESHKQKSFFYLRIAEKKVRRNTKDLQAWWELAVAENICGYKDRALRSASMTLRSPRQSPSRLFFIAALNAECGRKSEQGYIFEKAVCLLYPNLTHIEPGKKISAAKRLKNI